MRRQTWRRCIASSFYIKPQHRACRKNYASGCIASSFYIKPQQRSLNIIFFIGCIASSFYIKPQPHVTLAQLTQVVLHPLSTSNHNCRRCSGRSICVVLHPLSTSNHNTVIDFSNTYRLYCILFLHQTTTSDARHFDFRALNSQ